MTDRPLREIAAGPHREVGAKAEPPNDDLRDFLLVLRRALLQITGWIEERYLTTDGATPSGRGARRR